MKSCENCYYFGPLQSCKKISDKCPKYQRVRILTEEENTEYLKERQARNSAYNEMTKTEDENWGKELERRYTDLSVRFYEKWGKDHTYGQDIYYNYQDPRGEMLVFDKE